MVEIDDGVRAPKPLLNFFASHHFTRTLQQADQHPKRLGLESNAGARFAQFSRLGVGLEESEAKSARRLFLMFNGDRHIYCPVTGGDTTLYPR